MAGGGVDVGGIVAAAGTATTAVGGVVQLGVAQQSQVDVQLKNARATFGKKIGGMKRVLNEIAEVEATKASRLAWLRNDSNDAQHTWHGPQSDRWRLRGKTPYGAWKDNRIYRDPIKAADWKNYVEVRADRAVEKMRHSRAQTGAWNVANQGNIDQYRYDARRTWNDLIQAESIREIAIGVLLAHNQAPWSSEEILSPTNLHLMWSNDPEAAKDTSRGVVPFEARNRILTQLVNLAAMGLLPPTYRPPVWVYGLTPDEQRATPLGPTIAAVVALADQQSAANIVGAMAGVPAAYGTTVDSSATGSLQGRIRSMLLGDPKPLQAVEAEAAANPPMPPPPATPEAYQRALEQAREKTAAELPKSGWDTVWAVAGAAGALGALVAAIRWWRGR